jgi:carbon-monoxide dehydrogenase medium subunit
MKPFPFDYIAPTSIAEAVALLTSEPDARILAGGQSLVPMMNLHLAQPAVLVDLNGVTSLNYVAERAGGLAVGALTRQRSLERAPQVRQRWPVLTEALAYVGHPAIRVRGTIGGSLAHADPAAELPMLALLLDATLTVQSAQGERTIAARDFFIGALTTALNPGEILTEIWFPALPAQTGWGFQEVARRFGDFALAAAATTLRLDDQNRCSEARIALAGVGATPVRAPRSEALLHGAAISTGLLQEVARTIATEIEPESDLHASAAYRRQAAGVLTVRALQQAWQRAEQAIG